MPGTIWRAVRPLILMVVVVALVFTLFSVAVAFTTADKCGEFNSQKEWNYFPPRWDCTSPTIGN